MHIGVFKLLTDFPPSGVLAPKIHEKLKDWVPAGVEKACSFQDHFCALLVLVLSWDPTWLQVGAQDGPRVHPRGPRAAWDGNRGGFESPWRDTEQPTRLGPPKSPPGPIKIKQLWCILKSNKVDLRHLFERVFHDSGPLLHAWLGSTFLTFCLLKTSWVLDYTTKD